MEEYSDIDDFFDFSNESIIMVEEEEEEEEGLSVMASATADYYHYTEQPTAILDDEELYMPCEEVAHLEWLSNFVEESMSSSVADESLARVISTTANCKEVNQNTIINTLTANTNTNTNTNSTSGSGYGGGFSSSVSSSSFLRRKRLRLWDPQVILIDTARAASPVKHALLDSPSSTSTLTDSEDELTSSTKKKSKKSNQKNNQNNNQNKQKKVTEEERNAARKCQHCGSTKTPQWRAGPKGPKTLCNACGVRFKSGRLLPQYRPASSPSFDTTLHSNSHRRVLEMQTLIREEEEEEETA